MILYMTSFFQLSEGIFYRLDYFRSRLFWQGDSETNKYWLYKMECGLPPKNQGGFGVHDFEVKNRALLVKWMAKLFTKDVSGDAHSWFGLMATKKYFFSYGSVPIKDGSEIRFWEDKWLGNTTLCEQYSAMYNIVRHKSETLAKVLGSSPPSVTFIRDLVGPWLRYWDPPHLVRRT
jgi:hypothetical protein